MVWIYFQELAEYQKLSSLGYEQLHIVKTTDSAKPSLCQECQQVILIRHQCGMTLPPSTKESLEVSEMTSTSSSAASRSHARILALQDVEKAWKASEADYFSRSCAWPKRSSHLSYSLKTYRLSPSEGDFKWLEKLPRWGMIVGGVCYPLEKWELCTSESDGLCRGTPNTTIPTPTASDSRRGSGKTYSPKSKSQTDRTLVTYAKKGFPTPKARDYRDTGCPSEMERNSPSLASQMIQGSGKKLCPRWTSLLMGYPTTWLELEPLETLSCHPKLEKLLKF